MSIRYKDGVDDGVTEDLVCSLEKPMEAPDLTGQERAALAYTDRYFNNHLSIDDSHMDALREHFTEGQLVELNVRLAMSGFGKMAAVFDMTEVLPKHFQDKSAGQLTPWNAPHVVVG
jgi:alkylhydroperoxidase family enzyme